MITVPPAPIISLPLVPPVEALHWQKQRLDRLSAH